MQVVDAYDAPLAHARFDDLGPAVDHRAQNLDLVVAARGLDAVGDAYERFTSGGKLGKIVLVTS